MLTILKEPEMLRPSHFMGLTLKDAALYNSTNDGKHNEEEKE
jgi:hypothetical protein